MNGYLVLEDKTIIKGDLFGYQKEIAGEVVFTTGMVGYPESLTDPSYKHQILVFTYPLIGNYGVPSIIHMNNLIQNFESEKIQAEGVIVTYQTHSLSHWKAELSFDQWLKKNKIPGLTGVDTRSLTQKLREKGTMLGQIVVKNPSKRKFTFIDPNKKNIVKEVSCKAPIIYKGGKKTVLLLDCGVKASIIRKLLERKLTVMCVPWDFDPIKEKTQFDALVISNGPGDPKKVRKTINTVKKLLSKNIPTLGICYGNQILGLAAGGKTYKLKYGHRSQNQPCLLVGTQQAYITSQNHGFAVRFSSMPRVWKEWFRNLNDGTNEGIIHARKPFGSIQFHPEASPGPTDTEFIFDEFLTWLK